MEFEALAQSLLGQIKFLLPAWLPGGKFKGNEYRCGSLKGDSGDSFGVNLTTGVWADFASPSVKGGDLISLYAAIENLRQGEAYRILSEKYVPMLVGETPTQRKQQEIIPSKPPQDIGIPEMKHKDLGAPSAYWKYKNELGELLFYVARYDDPTCKKCCELGINKLCQKCGAKQAKELMPWCWVEKLKQFRSIGWPAPRPIYGLEQLNELPVVIVEGEKTCESARKILGGNYTVVTWPNGTGAIKKVDWSVLSGRHIILWPDADEVGVKAAYGIADQLEILCKEVKIIGVEGMPESWDAANALEEGWDYDKFIAWAKPRVKTIYPRDAEVVGKTEETEEVQNLPASIYALWDKLALSQTANNVPICNIDNVLRVFDGTPEFVDLLWYDEFHKKYYTKFNTREQREWTDIDELNITAFFQRELGMARISDDMIHKAAVIYGHKHKRNEPQDWLKSLMWDGKPRIEKFFHTHLGAEDGIYTDAVSRNFWVSMAARIFKPGCKVDNMVILEGGQGKYKSTALSIIGGPWYTESHEMVGTPNFYQGLQGKLIVEISELDSFSKVEANTIKRVISCATDRMRLPYARSTEDFPRQCIFVGTTNEDAYLRDHTGARRFWPVATKRIKLEKISDDRTQLFAEAVARLFDGQTWYEVPSEAMDIQESRRQADDWEPLVAKYLKEHNLNYFKTFEVAQGALGLYPERLGRSEQGRLGKIFRILGYRTSVTRVHGDMIRCWIKNKTEEENGF